MLTTLIDDKSLGRADAPETLLDFWRGALARLEDHPSLANPDMNRELVAKGFWQDPVAIQVLLCSRASHDALAGCEGALGVHLVSTPDGDPFGDDAAFARQYRVLAVSDRSEFLSLTEDLAKDDDYPEIHLHEYLKSYLNTVFHEIAHALLFAENAALLPPSEIECMSNAGEFDHDVFDCSTGYGIRPLAIDGQDIWADDMEEAAELMEIHVEALGRQFMRHALTGDSALECFPEAFGVASELERIIARRDDPDLA
ncbi:hypothetical protein [Defluviimonas salinarum]|uniref:Uncharacterized protein n=1 Tax=Defluviimonas salinarum TaxID=2992147 RepID=A0ABT3J485_9RHOB|nr:hypothetical protein [Defluviimonas salinarum]MCW3782475.1 hypothetical protein [Defluviimonas salinarum]